MRREIPRTLASLQPSYQGAEPHLYEVALAELPSERMLTAADLAGAPANLTHTAEHEALPLPVAVNRAVRRTRGSHVLLCIDGAALLSSGVLQRCRQVITINPRAMLAVHGLDLGPRPPGDGAGGEAPSPAMEDRLLEEIAFPKHPDRLFAVASWAASSPNGWFGPTAEPSAFLLPREQFESLGGYDERVGAAGDALARQDFYARATADRTRPLFVALGDATFHQGEDRTLAGRRPDAAALAAFAAGTGRPFVPVPPRPAQYLGALPPPTHALAVTSLVGAVRASAQSAGGVAPAALRAEARHAEPPERAAPRAPIVLVVGMHRSGTSFLARQLVNNGFIVPGTPLGGRVRSNPDGHFEPLELVAFHDRLLAGEGLGWSSLGTLDAERPGGRSLERQARVLRRLLLDLDRDDAPDRHAGWVLKDPRMCRALPVWQRLFALMGVRPPTLLVLRDPTLVAESLRRRDGFGLDFGRLLWARHVLDMLPLAEDAADLLCLDAVDGDGLAAYVGRRTGLAVRCEAVRQRPLGPASDPIGRLYRAFLDDRDLTALRDGLAAELAFLQRHPGVVRRLDCLAGLPDPPAPPTADGAAAG